MSVDQHEGDTPAQDHAVAETHSHDVSTVEHERPEDWGWHMEMGKVSRIAAGVVAAMLLILNIGNQTRHLENVYLTVLAIILILILVWDHYRRKNSWRG